MNTGTMGVVSAMRAMSACHECVMFVIMIITVRNHYTHDRACIAKCAVGKSMAPSCARRR